MRSRGSSVVRSQEGLNDITQDSGQENPPVLQFKKPRLSGEESFHCWTVDTVILSDLNIVNIK